MNRVALGLVVLAFLVSCGGRTPMSTWGYSSWVFKYGPAEMGKFESQRKQCLEQAGGPTATDENSFIQCMNQNGWCTREFACQPPSD